MVIWALESFNKYKIVRVTIHTGNDSDSEVDNESLQPSPTTQPPKPSTSLADKKTPTKRKHEAKSGNSTNKKAKKLSHDD